ncbi:penicillin-binding transpeptidase domain-containing protein [Arthrobacter pityocampae]|uniref:penicillin-binding transpeptidase domain-containing protein n=1 Tax=Arthrobacter pityocampae TaxID=547334 RepID=UPI0037356630
MNKSLAMTTFTLTCALLLTACNSVDDAAAHVAEDLAVGLEQGDLSQVDFKDSTADTSGDDAAALLETMAGIDRQVSVLEVREVDDDRVEATLQFEWNKPVDTQWKYETTASLVRAGGQWVVEWSPQIIESTLSDGERIEANHLPAERGRILDGSSDALVLPRPVRRVGISKNEIPPEQWESAARSAADAVGIDEDSYVEKVQAYGPEAFVEAITLREIVFQNLNYAKTSAVPGWTALSDEIPLAPSSSFARPLLGDVREATAEDIKQHEGKLSPLDTLGAGGLQETYDAELRGDPGWEVVAIDEETGAVRSLHRVEPQRGGDITTSLNQDLQKAAEASLATSATRSPSALVAIEPSTGAVLAAANGPEDTSYNTAFLGTYAPGSTFKTVTALAMLRAGASPDSTVDCSPRLEAAGRYFQNAGTYPPAYFGEITLREAIAQSCNTALIASHETLTQGDLADAAASLGVGNPVETGLPAFAGDIPRDSEDPAEHAAMMIGQGKVLTSPLTMATLMATISAGKSVHPYLVESVVDPDQAEPGPALTSAEADQLQSMLRSVVTDGHLQILLDVPGGPVMGKTGTAEFGNEDPLRTHSWVIAAQDDLAVAVFVEDGDYGSVTGGPIMSDFLRRASAISR